MQDIYSDYFSEWLEDDTEAAFELQEIEKLEVEVELELAGLLLDQEQDIAGSNNLFPAKKLMIDYTFHFIALFINLDYASSTLSRIIWPGHRLPFLILLVIINYRVVWSIIINNLDYINQEGQQPEK